MGMSASQARLLSITSRLTNNEFRAQTITNSKLRLATASQEASKDYMDALNSTQLMFMNYDDNGAASKVELTPAVLYDYAPMKNQYMLRNAANKILVNNTDAVNFTETNNLHEFLDRYGLLEGVENSVERIVTHNPKWDDWKVEHDKWKTEKPKQKDYKKTIQVEVGENEIKKWNHTNSRVYDAIADISCFGGTLGGSRCYMHVLSALLGFGEHTTSDGHTFIVHDYDGPAVTQPDGTITSGWNWCTCSIDEEATMTGLREELANDPVYDKPYDGDLDTDSHGIVPVGGDGSDATKYNKPLTVVGTNPETGNPIRVGGYCKQKCIDLLWKYHNEYDGSGTGGDAPLEERKEIWYFIELDLGEGKFDIEKEKIYEDREVDDVDKYKEAVDKWKKEEPEEPIKETVTEKYVISDVIVNDQPKAQWYTNLWHALNGSETANTVEYKQLKSSWDTSAEYGYKVKETDKSIRYTSFEILDSNLASSAEWLKFALEQGIVTMEQAKYYDPSEDSAKAMELTAAGYKWDNITYTSARDFVQQNNQRAIAIAEVKYKRKVTEIENKEEKLDQDLKKLDTEHTALQTEYESIKEVLSKNVERSFKAFS